MKSTAILTIALFLTVAPSPDAETLSEMTAGFLKTDKSLEITDAKFKPEFQTVYNDSNPSFQADNGF